MAEQDPYLKIQGAHSGVVQVFSDVFVVSGKMNMGPMQIARNMQIVRERRQLCIINSVRVSEDVLKEIEALGTVKHVIKNGAHGVDDAFYVERYGAALWSVPTAKWNPKFGKKGIKMERNLLEDVPFKCMTAVRFDDETRAAGPSADCREGSSVNVVVKTDKGGVLLSNDMVQNYEPHDDAEKISEHTLNGGFTDFMSRMLGFSGRVITPWMFMQNYAPGRDPKQLKHEIEKVLSHDWQHLVPCHGVLALNTAKQEWISSLEKWYGKDWYVQE
uniref:Uncharacterized protein n=1 Tax=Hemiselmis andersenii TaxID=464988 RepID=A0A6U5BCC0_HEMAN